jgi:hypothetical protein
MKFKTTRVNKTLNLNCCTEDGSELKGIETFFKPPSLWASSANKLGFGTNAALTKTILLVLLHYFL